jgi:hypothetical protein
MKRAEEATMNNTEILRNEITALRKLAESGRTGPVLGGFFLAAAGLVFGLSCFVSWAGHAGLFPFGGWSELYLWLGAFTAFAAVWLVIAIRLRAQPKATTAATAVFGTIWAASGAGIMVVFVSTFIVAYTVHSLVVLNTYIPAIFAFYGTAWLASGALARCRWMYGVGGLSFVFAVILAFLAGTLLQIGVMGIALLLLLTVPGVKLVQDETRANEAHT